ncbi:MAG: hypothetical protein ACXWN1_22100 [Thermoanaerobaculia bacterium]
MNPESNRKISHRLAPGLLLMTLYAALASTAFAQDAVRSAGPYREPGTAVGIQVPGERQGDRALPLLVPPGRDTRETPPLFVEIPAFSGPATLEVRFLHGEVVIAAEIVELDAKRPARAAMNILNDHQKELLKIRALEAEQHASVKVQVLGAPVDVPERSLAEIETRSRMLESVPTAGMTKSVQVSLAAARRGSRIAANWTPDPECVQQCDDERQFCYEDRCDPRGSCEFCEQYWRDCYYSCPEVCTEPKDVYNVFGNWTYIGTNYLGNACLDIYPHNGIGTSHSRWQYVARLNVYQRTEHCDGTYTDVFTGYTYEYYYCYTSNGYNCNNPQYVYNPNIC